jgi:DNA transposition AAA+ family ATPase
MHVIAFTLVFASTIEYHLFGEFCDACRKYRYIGLCHGVPGAGKTNSAREYASWDALSLLFPEELFTLVGRRHLDEQFPQKPFAMPGSPAYTEVLPCRTAYDTAPESAMAHRIEREVMVLSYVVEAVENASRDKDDFLYAYRPPKRIELVIVDEADRLKMAGLEQL